MRETLANKQRVYWDSCNWIGLINEEKNKIEHLHHILDRAKKKEIEILTSAFTLAEVFKTSCEEAEKSLPEEKDRVFEEYLMQEFVVFVQVTWDIGIYARKLLRRIEGLKKPQDAIHLASAAYYNVDEVHTFDRNHMLPFNNMIDRRDGQKLKICIPPLPPGQVSIFDHLLLTENKGESEKESLPNENKQEEKPGETEERRIIATIQE